MPVAVVVVVACSHERPRPRSETMPIRPHRPERADGDTNMFRSRRKVGALNDICATRELGYRRERRAQTANPSPLPCPEIVPVFVPVLVSMRALCAIFV